VESGSVKENVCTVRQRVNRKSHHSERMKDVEKCIIVRSKRIK